MRRLPVYLIIDTSYSMRGIPIESVKIGIRQLTSSLRSNPYALETVFLSIIAFNTTAAQLVPLTELYLFQFHDLAAKGKSALGAALKLTKERIEDEVVKSTSEIKGDWKPILFLMTDGGSSDSWRNAAKQLRNLDLGMFVCCAAGNKANVSVLQTISETVVQMRNLDGNSIKEFFKWVSDSIATTSMKIETSNEQQNNTCELPPLPKEIILI